MVIAQDMRVTCHLVYQKNQKIRQQKRPLQADRAIHVHGVQQMLRQGFIIISVLVGRVLESTGNVVMLMVI